MDCCVMGLKIISLRCDVVTIDTFRNIIFLHELFSYVLLDHSSGVLNIDIVYTYHFFHINNFYVIRFQCLVLQYCKITFIASDFLFIMGRCQNIFKIIYLFIFIMFIIITLDQFPRELMRIIDCR